MNPSAARNIARAFWLAAARNMEKRWTSPTSYEMLLVPSVVCSAFGIEVAIKSILMRSGTVPRTHNLEKLFGLLPETIRSEAVEKSGIPKSEFEAKLASIANVFEEWRYLFESQSAGFDNGFLQWLASFMETASAAVAEKA